MRSGNGEGEGRGRRKERARERSEPTAKKGREMEKCSDIMAAPLLRA